MEDALAALLLGLDLLPSLPHARRCSRLRVPEHVRMPSNELLVRGACDGLEVTLALLLEQQREERHLEQQVAELVGELGRVTADRRVGDLVCLLDGVRDDGDRGLLAIPGAVLPQAPRQLVQVEERTRERLVAHGR